MQAYLTALIVPVVGDGMRDTIPRARGRAVPRKVIDASAVVQLPCGHVFGEPALIANGDDIIVVVAQVIRDRILTVVAPDLISDQTIQGIEVGRSKVKVAEVVSGDEGIGSEGGEGVVLVSRYWCAVRENLGAKVLRKPALVAHRNHSVIVFVHCGRYTILKLCIPETANGMPELRNIAAT